MERHHGIPGPLPLRTRPLLVPQPRDHDWRALRLLALREAGCRPVVALHPGRRLHAAQGIARSGNYLWNERVLNNYFCKACGIFTYIADGENGKDGYRVNLGCVEGIDALALEIRVIDGKSVPLADAPH